MRPRSAPLAIVVVVAVGLAAVLGACAAPTGSAIGGSGEGVLAVTNTSAATVYVRFGEADGSTITYRADPDTVGRAVAADPATTPASLMVLSAECRVLSQQTDPALGQLLIEGRGSLSSTAADDPEVMTRPLLPTDDAACP
jgi:hypothetical protein